MKKVLGTIALITVLGTSAFAGNKYSCDNKGDNFKKQHSMKKHHKGSMHKNNMKNNHGFMFLLRELNLTTKQKDEIKKIMKDSFAKKTSLNQAFTAKSFDKQKYIKDSLSHRENMIKSKADMISKVYNVLSTKQKSQLKVLMDLKEEKLKTKGMNFDKNSNGRG